MSTDILVLGGVVVIAFVIIAILLLKQKSGGGDNTRDQTVQIDRPGASTTSSRSASGGSASGATSGSQGRSQTATGTRPTSGSGGATGGSIPEPQGSAELKYNWLLGKKGGVEAKSFHIGEKMVTLGRDVGNYLQVRDEMVSGRHAMLIGTPHGMQITDLDSSNGTFVNGRQLGQNEEYNLDEGDTIEVGDTLFVYQRSGRYENDALTHKKASGDGGGGKTKTAMSMQNLSGGGDLKQQVLMAVGANGGDFQAAAQQLGLDVEIVEQICDKADEY